MRLTPTLFVLFHCPRGCVTTDNTRDKTLKPFGLRQSTLTDAVCTNILEIRYLGATMASLDDQLNKLKDQMAKDKESREAAEARAEAKAEARADEQRKQHGALLKIFSQLQSPSGHEEAKN